MTSGLAGLCFGEFDDAGQAVFHRELFARYAALLRDEDRLRNSVLWPRVVDPGVGQVELEPQEFLDELRRYLEAADPDAEAEFELFEELESRAFYLTPAYIDRAQDPVDAELLSISPYILVQHFCRFGFAPHFFHEVAAALLCVARNADEDFVVLLYNAMQECLARGLTPNPEYQELDGFAALTQFLVGCVGIELHQRMVLTVDLEEDCGFGIFDRIAVGRDEAQASSEPAETQSGDAMLLRYFNQGVVRLKPQLPPD